MPFVPVPNTIQLEVRGTLLSEDVENTFYYLSPGAIDQAILDAVAEASRDYVEAEISQFSSGFLFKEVYARDLSSGTFLSSLAPASGVFVGAFADPAPNNATFALKRTSGFSGRSARGRIFWMGIAETMTNGDNFMTSIVADNMVDWLLNHDLAVAAEGVAPVIVSRFNAGVPRTTGVTYPIADWSYSDLRLDTMRGRLPGN